MFGTEKITEGWAGGGGCAADVAEDSESEAMDHDVSR
jgi:hypothetical protein